MGLIHQIVILTVQFWLTELSICRNSLNASTCTAFITFPVGGAPVTWPQVVILTSALNVRSSWTANCKKTFRLTNKYIDKFQDIEKCKCFFLLVVTSASDMFTSERIWRGKVRFAKALLNCSVSFMFIWMSKRYW